MSFKRFTRKIKNRLKKRREMKKLYNKKLMDSVTARGGYRL